MHASVGDTQRGEDNVRKDGGCIDCRRHHVVMKEVHDRSNSGATKEVPEGDDSCTWGLISDLPSACDLQVRIHHFLNSSYRPRHSWLKLPKSPS